LSGQDSCARKAAAGATISGGMLFFICSTRSRGCDKAAAWTSAIRVPARGARELTLMPWEAPSMATLRVSPKIAAFAAP